MIDIARRKGKYLIIQRQLILFQLLSVKDCPHLSISGRSSNLVDAPVSQNQHQNQTSELRKMATTDGGDNVTKLLKRNNASALVWEYF